MTELPNKKDGNDFTKSLDAMFIRSKNPPLGATGGGHGVPSASCVSSHFFHTILPRGDHCYCSLTKE